jgi:hypothetical protein
VTSIDGVDFDDDEPLERGDDERRSARLGPPVRLAVRRNERRADGKIP